MKRFAWLLLLAACGGSPKPPLEPVSDNPLPPEDDAGVTATPTPEDAGAPVASETADAAAPVAATPPADDTGPQTMLKQFVAPGADHAALTRALRPTTADYKALFDASTAPRVEAAQSKEWASSKAVIKPSKAGQTEVKVWPATGAELAGGTGNAKEFPAGYAKIAKHLQPGVTFYRFKFVEPGKDVGTAYDGLAFVNGHWVVTPKPWRALEGKDEPADKPKPKTRPKKK